LPPPWVLIQDPSEALKGRHNGQHILFRPFRASVNMILLPRATLPRRGECALPWAILLRPLRGG